MLVSTHICVGNVSARPYLGVKASSFNSYMCEVCFNSYICGECFGPGHPKGDCGAVSIHICTGNVSPLVLWWFQLIYVRGMFPSASGIGRWSTRWFRLIYVRGECFNTGRGHQPMGISFNSYMCGEYFWRLVDVISKCVSTHICAGNVSFARSRYDSAHFISTHICAGNVSAFMRGFAILDGANPQELDCSLRVRAVIYRMR